MELTLLGTGDMTGVPPLFSDLSTANANAKRRRSGLLVETAESTVLFDVGPDIREQLGKTQTKHLDAAFLTHFHHDHSGGIDDLGVVAELMNIDIHMTETAASHLERERGYLLNRFEPHLFAHGASVGVGDLRIVPFPVAHGRPRFDTVGFSIYHNGEKVVYAPDIHRFCPDRRAGTEYENATILFIEGSQFYRPELRGDATFDELVADSSADKTVLVHVNEHLIGMSTDAMDETAHNAGYELGKDFETYHV